MALLRLITVLVIAGILVLFTLQNWSASLQLVFLGLRSPAFPLPLWIVGAIAAGVLTSIVISLLFGLTRFTAKRSVRRTQTNSASSYTYNSPYSRPAEPPQQPPTNASSRDRDFDDDDDDWFSDNGPDWTDEPRRTDFEKRQQPTSSNQSGSSYSYTYREPSPRSEVVDADFRVIVPPSRNLEDDLEERDR
jgi:uncharacterized integral membrane protein